jgi:hypothetical protein
MNPMQNMLSILEENGHINLQEIAALMADAENIIGQLIADEPDVSRLVFTHGLRESAAMMLASGRANAELAQMLDNPDLLRLATVLRLSVENSKLLALPWALACRRLRPDGKHLKSSFEGLRKSPDQVLGQLACRYPATYTPTRMEFAMLIRRSEAHNHTVLLRDSGQISLRDAKMAHPRYYGRTDFVWGCFTIYTLLQIVSHVYAKIWLPKAVEAFSALAAKELTKEQLLQMAQHYQESHNLSFPGDRLTVADWLPREEGTDPERSSQATDAGEEVAVPPTSRVPRGSTGTPSLPDGSARSRGSTRSGAGRECRCSCPGSGSRSSRPR